MHTYLSLIDPMLFVVLKAIRRTFENHKSLSWYITGDIAMYLYAYSCGMPPSNFPLDRSADSLFTPQLELRVVLRNLPDISHMEAALEELIQQGFVREGKDFDLHYPLSLTHVRIQTVNQQEGDLIWLRNTKGKHTYPLLEPKVIMDQKEALLNRLPLSEKIRQLDLQDWMKEVMTRLIIE